MKLKLGVYSSLREYLNPRPPLGEYIILDVSEGTPVSKIITNLGLPLHDVAIIMVNGKHQSKDYLVQATDEKIALFPVSGGG